MKILTTLVSLCVLLGLTGCTIIVPVDAPQGSRLLERVRGSGKLETRTLSVSEFDQLLVANDFVVTIRQGDAPAVVVTMDDNLHAYLQEHQAGRTLKLALKSTDAGSGIVYENATLRAEVTVPLLRRLELSGNAQATMAGQRSAEDFRVIESGNATLEGDLQAGNVTIDLSGSAVVTLSGSARDLSFAASGNSHGRLGAFRAQDARVSASGSSRAEVNATGTLDVPAASGSAAVEYVGSPTLGAQHTSGSASLRQR